LGIFDKWRLYFKFRVVYSGTGSHANGVIRDDRAADSKGHHCDLYIKNAKTLSQGEF
jgi:hypothetical protein